MPHKDLQSARVFWKLCRAKVEAFKSSDISLMQPRRASIKTERLSIEIKLGRHCCGTAALRSGGISSLMTSVH